MSLNKIVVAVDMDENCLETLSQMKEVLTSDVTEIHLVHIFEFMPNIMDLSYVFSPSEKDLFEIRALMLEKLKGIQHRLGLDKFNVRIECIVATNARQEFLQYVDKHSANLVIAASKERSGFVGLFEGSFTSFLSKYCRSNLMILRPVARYTIG